MASTGLLTVSEISVVLSVMFYKSGSREMKETGGEREGSRYSSSYSMVMVSPDDLQAPEVGLTGERSSSVFSSFAAVDLSSNIRSGMKDGGKELRPWRKDQSDVVQRSMLFSISVLALCKSLTFSYI